MLVRVAIVCTLGIGILWAGCGAAEDLSPEQTRAFVVGKLFSYICFEGTAGMGRVFSDGSVVGTWLPRLNRWIGLRLLRLLSAKSTSTSRQQIGQYAGRDANGKGETVAPAVSLHK
jgi:hypothetical protein